MKPPRQLRLVKHQFGIRARHSNEENSLAIEKEHIPSHEAARSETTARARHMYTHLCVSAKVVHDATKTGWCILDVRGLDRGVWDVAREKTEAIGRNRRMEIGINIAPRPSRRPPTVLMLKS